MYILRTLSIRDIGRVLWHREVRLLRYIERLIDETGSDLGKVLDYFGVTALTELSSHAASRAITSLEKQRRAA